jgi:hypothetical protein
MAGQRLSINFLGAKKSARYVPLMAENTDIRRRIVGAFFLLTALILLILGETKLSDRLRSHPWEFIFFWLGCFISVGLALLMALLDMATVRRRVRREERELIENTLREISRVKASKAGKSPENSGS